MRLTKIAQTFPDPRVANVEADTRQQLARLAARIPRGGSVAITAGSRGITDIVPVMRAIVSFVREQGASPFVVPAMGSHGGATARGQVELLEGYGVTESAVGAPIRSSMETVELPRGDNPCAVYMDRLAWESDGVILVNRVKPHTDFHGPYESGLAKMTVIGLGKHDQALAIHTHGVYGLKELIAVTARTVFESGKVLAGVGIVENAYDRTMAVRALAVEEVMDEEPKLLALARDNMPRLPVDRIDILLVDFLGKNISGVGMDPNIIGRMYIRGEPEPERPRISAIVVGDVTDESHGNALGVGLADITTRQLFDRINFEALYENVYTSTFYERAKVPVIAETDAEAFSYALRTTGPRPTEDKRIVRIRDTLHPGEAWASKAVVDEIGPNPGIAMQGEPREMFDEAGKAMPF